jgi:hypothetical protein
MIINLSPDMKADLVRQLIEAGCATSIAHETIDLAAHAIDTAIEAVKTVCQRGSMPQVVMSAHPLALGLLSTVAKVHAEAAETGARKVAEQLGMKIVVPNENEGSPKT